MSTLKTFPCLFILIKFLIFFDFLWCLELCIASTDDIQMLILFKFKHNTEELILKTTLQTSHLKWKNWIKHTKERKK